MNDTRDYNQIFEIFENEENEIEYFGRSLGKSAYGEVREIKLKNSVKMMTSKLVKKERDDDKMTEIKVAQEIRGNNIIKINKVITKIINDEEYDLIIMEKVLLRDLGKLFEYYHKHNLLNLIGENTFDKKEGENTSNNLLRFFSKQIIDGLEILDRNDFVHFDIRPELLATNNLIIKISDFSLVTKNKNDNDNDKIRIPGGTQGYLTPEYYNKEKVSNEVARKQDCFALGSI